MDPTGSMIRFIIDGLITYMFAMAVAFEVGVIVLCRSLKLHGLFVRLVQFGIAAYIALVTSFFAWLVSSADWGWRLSTVASSAIAAVVYLAAVSGFGFSHIDKRSKRTQTVKQMAAKSVALGFWCTGIAFTLRLIINYL